MRDRDRENDRERQTGRERERLLEEPALSETAQQVTPERETETEV